MAWRRCALCLQTMVEGRSFYSQEIANQFSSNLSNVFNWERKFWGLVWAETRNSLPDFCLTMQCFVEFELVKSHQLHFCWGDGIQNQAIIFQKVNILFSDGTHTVLSEWLQHNISFRPWPFPEVLVESEFLLRWVVLTWQKGEHVSSAGQEVV